MLPTASASSHPAGPPAAMTSGAAGASGLSGGHNPASTGEEGPLKKPKKERKERGRENGKDECECWIGADFGRFTFTFPDIRPIVLFPRVSSVPKKMSKKRKLADGSRKLVQPIALDSSGRPVFPIALGGLTVYSLGEVSVWLFAHSFITTTVTLWTRMLYPNKQSVHQMVVQ